MVCIAHLSIVMKLRVKPQNGTLLSTPNDLQIGNPA
jgi:hypothetical protein